MKITITKITDGITPDMRKKLLALQNRRPLLRAAAQGAMDAMRAHYRGLPPNQRGFPSLNFWEKEGARKVALAEVTNNSATVVVDSVAMGHRFTGGTVRPKRAGALSIPLSPEAYQAGSASLFPQPLTMVNRPGKPPLLVETGLIGKSKAWKPHYALLKSVTHQPDPRAWPPREKVEPSVLRIIREKLATILRVSR